MKAVYTLGEIQSDAVGIVFTICLLGMMLVGVLPALIAFCKKHPNRWVILGINIFFGATGLGWFIALIWALNLLHIEPRKPRAGDNK